MGTVSNSGRPPLDERARQRDREQPSPFDLITRLVLPVGLLLVAVLQYQDQGGWFWSLSGLAFLSFVVGLYHPVLKPAIGKISRWRARRWDRRRVKEALPEFQSFVRQFGCFVDRDRSRAHDQLTEIVERRIRQENVNGVKTLEITDEQIFRGFWNQLRRRLDQQARHPNHFVTAIEEFNYLFSQFLQETVVPAFDRMPTPVRHNLPDSAKRDLNDYRERLLQVRDAYHDFVTDLAKSLDIYDLREPYLPRPKEHP